MDRRDPQVVYSRDAGTVRTCPAMAATRGQLSAQRPDARSGRHRRPTRGRESALLAAVGADVFTSDDRGATWSAVQDDSLPGPRRAAVTRLGRRRRCAATGWLAHLSVEGRSDRLGGGRRAGRHTGNGPAGDANRRAAASGIEAAISLHARWRDVAHRVVAVRGDALRGGQGRERSATPGGGHRRIAGARRRQPAAACGGPSMAEGRGPSRWHHPSAQWRIVAPFFTTRTRPTPSTRY